MAGEGAPRRDGLLADARHILVQAIGALCEDFCELRLAGPRARQATIAALAVTLAVGIAMAMHLPEVWWAGTSAFMSTQATRPASIQKGVLRIIGTMAGAGLALVLVGWLAYDHLACCLALLTVCSVGILGVIVSPHGYAWLLSTITFSLVVLMSLADPLSGFSFAAFRTLEVVIGTASAMLIALALAPAAAADAAPVPPGWQDLLGAQWPEVQHAVRSGIAVALLPVVWSFFDLPALSAMSMTVVSVMAVPVLADHRLDDRAAVVPKALQRVLGCVLGGVPGLFLLALPLAEFVPWLAALTAGVWLCAYLQSNTRGAGYVGVQGAFAFIATLVQGEGPPGSILPGIDRLVGILLGLATLFVVCVLVQPGAAVVDEAVPGR